MPTLTLILCGGYILHVRSQPTYGLPENSETEYTVAPGVSVQVLPAHRNLIGKVFLDFDTNDEGAVVISTPGGIYDMVSGRRVGPNPGREGESITALAFARPGLSHKPP